ncbi:MAG: DUF3794 domain-containing protein [Epulopiscium sp.]|jgi:LysM repeat protein|nr:DUF3794 domain-containing protein [Candidatus Epulonipiscium sp.]HOQ17276.1 DUF3794 domain-containing protein [Defluviitaleaceae bacterium]HPT75681.1 DUF3794 domain-containing protein [Defluviitaleaceae bacterium]
MSLELIKETVEFDQIIGKESVQIIVEGDIIVPDIKPDILKVLQIDGKIDMGQLDISADRLNYKGQVKVNILYAAEGSERSIHTMSASLSMDDFINMDGIKKDMSYQLDYFLEHLDYSLINSRKLNVRALITLNAKVVDKKQNAVVVGTDSRAPIQVQTRDFNYYKTVGSKQDKIIIKDELTVPAGKANIQEILKNDISLSNKEVRTGDDTITVKGYLNIRTLYASSMGEKEIEYMEHSIPYNGSIDCPGAGSEEGIYCYVDIKVSNYHVQVKPDLDGEERILDIEVELQVNVRVISVENLKIIDDAYCPGKEILIRKEKIPYQRLVNKLKEVITLNEVINIDSDLPDINYIYNVEVRPKIEEIQLFEDKIALEGMAEVKMIYMSEDEEKPVCVYESMLPFKKNIVAEGASLEKKLEVKVDVDDIIYSRESQKDFQVNIILNLDVDIIDEQKVEIIVDMTEKDLDPDVLLNMPSLIIYMVQCGDTLWKIAKKYNTTVEELVAINDIENPDKIYPGQKLLIIKKI